MAIDMIENNELGALSTSRIGGFADENLYIDFLGMGKNKGRKGRARMRAEGTLKAYSIDPAQETNCDYLRARLSEIQINLQAELNKNPNKWERKAKVDPLITAEANYKNALSRNKCDEKQSQAEEQKFKKETEEAILRASQSTPAIPDVKVAKGSKTTKIILVAVGLVVVGVVGVALFRKK